MPTTTDNDKDDIENKKKQEQLKRMLETAKNISDKLGNVLIGLNVVGVGESKFAGHVGAGMKYAASVGGGNGAAAGSGNVTKVETVPSSVQKKEKEETDDVQEEQLTALQKLGKGMSSMGRKLSGIEESAGKHLVALNALGIGQSKFAATVGAIMMSGKLTSGAKGIKSLSKKFRRKQSDEREEYQKKAPLWFGMMGRRKEGQLSIADRNAGVGLDYAGKNKLLQGKFTSPNPTSNDNKDDEIEKNTDKTNNLLTDLLGVFKKKSRKSEFRSDKDLESEREKKNKSVKKVFHHKPGKGKSGGGAGDGGVSDSIISGIAGAMTVKIGTWLAGGGIMAALSGLSIAGAAAVLAPLVIGIAATLGIKKVFNRDLDKLQEKAMGLMDYDPSKDSTFIEGDKERFEKDVLKDNKNRLQTNGVLVDDAGRNKVDTKKLDKLSSGMGYQKYQDVESLMQTGRLEPAHLKIVKDKQIEMIKKDANKSNENSRSVFWAQRVSARNPGVPLKTLEPQIRDLITQDFIADAPSADPEEIKKIVDGVDLTKAFEKGKENEAKKQERQKSVSANIKRENYTKNKPPQGTDEYGVSPLNKAMDNAGITNKNERAMFLAQMSHESGNFKYTEEIASGQDYDKTVNPKLAKKLGNTEVGDGKKFKGRGYIQLTGRANYKKYGDMVCVDLISNPELAARPDIAERIAIAYWMDRVDRDAAKEGDVKTVTQAINGGENGLPDRQRKFAQYAKDQTVVTAAADNNNGVKSSEKTQQLAAASTTTTKDQTAPTGRRKLQESIDDISEMDEIDSESWDMDYNYYDKDGNIIPIPSDGPRDPDTDYYDKAGNLIPSGGPQMMKNIEARAAAFETMMERSLDPGWFEQARIQEEARQGSVISPETTTQIAMISQKKTEELSQKNAASANSSMQTGQNKSDPQKQQSQGGNNNVVNAPATTTNITNINMDNTDTLRAAAQKEAWVI